MVIYRQTVHWLYIFYKVAHLPAFLGSELEPSSFNTNIANGESHTERLLIEVLLPADEQLSIWIYILDSNSRQSSKFHIPWSDGI